MLRRPGRASLGLHESLWVVLVMAVPLFVNPYSRFNFEPDKAALFRAVTILLVLTAALVMPRLARDVVRIVLRPIPILLACLWALVGLSTLFSIEPGRSFWGEPRWGQGLVTFSCFAAIFGLAAWVLNDPSRRGLVIDAALFASLPVALYGLLQAVGIDPLSMTPPSERIQSTQPHANALGGYIAMVIPLTLHRTLGTAGRERSLWAGLLAAQAVCLVLTVSRSSYLAAGAGSWLVLMLLAWGGGRKRLVIGLSILAIIVLAGLAILSSLPPPPGDAPQVWRAASTLFSMSGPTAQVRSLVWRSVLDAVARRPWLGYGPETLTLALPAVMHPRLVLFGGLGSVAGRAHNEILEMALFSGLPAAAIDIALIVMVAWRGWRKWLSGDGLAGALLASAGAGLIHHLLDVTTITTGMLFWLWLGMLASRSIDAVFVRDTQLFAGQAVRFALGAGAAILIGWVAIVPAWADIAGREGMALGALGAWDAAGDALAHAEALDPRTGVYTLPRAEVEVGQYQDEHNIVALSLAASRLKNAVAHSPSDPEIWSALVEARRLQAYEVDPAFWPQAYAACQSLLRAAPFDANAYLQCGDLRLWARQPAGAIPYYRVASLLAPDYDQPYFNLATAYRAIGEFARADVYSRLALEKQQAWQAALAQR